MACIYGLICAVPVISENVDRYRFMFAGANEDPAFSGIQYKILYLVGTCVKYAFLLAAIFLFSIGKKTKWEIIAAWAIMGVAFLTYSSQGGRGYPFELLVLGLVLYHYIHRPVSNKRLLMGLVVLTILLGVGGYLRSIRGNERVTLDVVTQMSDMPRTPFWDSVVYGYYTVTVGFEVFYRLTLDLPTRGLSGPGYLFYFLHRWIPRENISAVAGGYYGGAMVVPTYLGELYADFGIWGILGGSLLLGCAYGAVYQKALQRRSFYWIYVQALFIYLLAYFPYVNMFSMYVNWLIDMITMAILLEFATARSVHSTSPVLLPIALPAFNPREENRAARRGVSDGGRSHGMECA
jgi:oligosaccharide repeat unit polymerase